jgi:hypothetical protein
MKLVSARRRAHAPESGKTPGFPDPDIPARTISFPSPPRSARGRRKSRGTSEAGKQLAVPVLFNVMVAGGSAACSGQRRQDAERPNPRSQIGTPRSGDPFPSRQPATNKKKKRKALSTPAPPLIHLRPAIPAERTQGRPGLCRRARSYCGREESERGRRERSHARTLVSQLLLAMSCPLQSYRNLCEPKFVLLHHRNSKGFLKRGMSGC